MSRLPSSNCLEICKESQLLNFPNVKIHFTVRSKSHTLRKKRLFLELLCFIFSHIRTEYGEIWSISPYYVKMRENADQNDSEYGQFFTQWFAGTDTTSMLLSLYKSKTVVVI